MVTTLAAALLLALAQPAPADLVVVNARIWSDGLVEFAETAAVRDGRFVHVGSPRPELFGPATERVDAAGRVIIPGMIDSHVHMLSGGEGLSRLNLRHAADRRDFARRVREWAESLPAGAWVLGGRWSTESWAVPQQPTRAWVDDAAGDRPLFLSRMDGHSALANSEALRRAGITRDGPADPVGGVIDRDPKTGEPTGILRDSAMGLVSQHIPAPSVDDQVKALRRAAGEALRHGVTAAGDIPSIGDLPAYAKLAESPPPFRFFLYLTAGDWARAATSVRGFTPSPGRIELNGFKGYVDGSLGSRTAYMREPYLGNPSDRPQWRGLLREGVEDGRFTQNVAVARIYGVQPITHAIGDEANHMLLGIYEQAFEDELRSARCRVEHVQHLLPQDIARFSQLGVIASMQPFHKADDGRYAEEYIGAQRCRTSYAFKSLLDAGAIVVFGSDWPVVTLNPFLGIEAAVTGRTLDGKAWQTQENITVAEALRCYTSRGAYAAFAENELGRIAPGYRADFVILDRSPFESGVDWSAIEPIAVYVEGRRAYVR